MAEHLVESWKDAEADDDTSGNQSPAPARDGTSNRPCSGDDPVTPSEGHQQSERLRALNAEVRDQDDIQRNVNRQVCHQPPSTPTSDHD